MNYYKPRQRKDGRWDYTCSNDGAIWPVGYCSKHRPLSHEVARMFRAEEDVEQFMLDEAAKEKPFLPHYHEDGHATPEEAGECYKRYLLDHSLRFGEHKDVQYRCQVCGVFTQEYASIPCEMKHWELCETHNNRESVEKLMPTPCECWSS